MGDLVSTALYDTDYYKWTKEQAGLLRDGRMTSLDIEHLIEELEHMGARERRELVNRLVVLLVHLLKWQFQPERRGNSWRRTIKAQRMEIADLLCDNPSLKSQMGNVLARAYKKARFYAADETNLAENCFPSALPYSPDDLLNDDFWPG